LEVSNDSGSIIEKVKDILIREIVSEGLDSAKEVLGVNNASREIGEGDLRNVEISLNSADIQERLKRLDNSVSFNYGVVESRGLLDFKDSLVKGFRRSDASENITRARSKKRRIDATRRRRINFLRDSKNF
jgi:hypothetical protein